MHRDSVLIENYNLPHQGGRRIYLLKLFGDALRMMQPWDVIDCVVDRLINEIVCPLIWTF